jgi:hypothetical protein
VSDIEDAEFVEDISMRRGPVWALISVPSVGEEGFDVKVEVGPVLDLDSLKNLLRKTLEAL